MQEQGHLLAQRPRPKLLLSGALVRNVAMLSNSTSWGVARILFDQWRLLWLSYFLRGFPQNHAYYSSLQTCGTHWQVEGPLAAHVRPVLEEIP